MRRLAAALALVVALIAPASAGRPLPWSTFSEMAKDVIGATPGACRVGAGSHENLSATVRHGEDVYQFIATEDGVWVLALLAETGPPLVIYRGHQLPSPDQDNIVVESEHPYVSGGPCEELYPQEA